MGSCSSKQDAVIKPEARTTSTTGKVNGNAKPGKSTQSKHSNGNVANGTNATKGVPQTANDPYVNGAKKASRSAKVPKDTRLSEPKQRKSVIESLDKSDHNILVSMQVEVPFGRTIETVYEGVHDGPELGTGVSGIVRKVTHRTTRTEYAVKCLDLGQVQTEKQLQQLREEVAIMCQLDHPNVVRLEEVYESPTAIYLVQELCSGGDLFDRLDAQPDEHYTEADCARLMKQMIAAVRYIHKKGIIHRDMKLENFMFSNSTEESELKMIDFGLSKHFEYGDVHEEQVGSAYTVAPEVIRGSYDERCDNWSLGVITYLLLSGDTPFGGAGEPKPMSEVRKDILQANYVFEPEEIWETVSQEAIDFIQSLLVTDPKIRPTAKELQKSPWLSEWIDAQRDGDEKLNPNVVKALVNFREMNDMHKLLYEVLSFTLLPEQLDELRKQFEIMDPNGRGEISLKDLKKVLLQNAADGSLGALTEQEIEDIFNAMRVRKTDTRIHWHGFIAAGLSQVKIDERNLELAFERLDTEHKGYIEFENVMQLIGGYSDESEEKMREHWTDVMADCGSEEHKSHITKEQFVLLMKGQTHDDKLGMSKKLDTSDHSAVSIDEEKVGRVQSFESDSQRAVCLPEHTHDNKEIETAIRNEGKTPLVVNKQLYRAHRQMRLAVLEASRRFEEDQMKRASEKMNESLGKESAGKYREDLYSAGLVMRHSKDAKASSESVRAMVQQAQKEQQALLEKAYKKSGRAPNRKKAFSDMKEFMQSAPPGSTSPPRSQRKISVDLSEAAFKSTPALEPVHEEASHNSESLRSHDSKSLRSHDSKSFR